MLDRYRISTDIFNFDEFRNGHSFSKSVIAHIPGSLPDELVILGNEQALHQVFINLLINAEQAFAKDQKAKTIEVRAYKLTRDRAIIKIIDNGA